MHGQVFVFFILTVAAAESAIGLAILVVLFRNRASINRVDETRLTAEGLSALRSQSSNMAPNFPRTCSSPCRWHRWRARSSPASSAARSAARGAHSVAILGVADLVRRCRHWC